MKKLFKVVVLIIIILFNFIFCNYSVYADDEDEITYSYEDYNQMTQEGTVNLGENEVDLSISTSTSGSASGTIASTVTPWFMGLQDILTTIAEGGGVTGGIGYTELDSSACNTGMFTVCSLVFGEYLLFNVNVSQTSASLNSDASTSSISDMIDELKESVAGWYYIIELVAIILMLVLIIYTAIRLALSLAFGNFTDEEKKAIETWAKGVVFILLLPSIISILNVLVENIEDLLWNFRYSLEKTNGYVSFEYGLLEECLNGFENASGMTLLAYAIEYIAFLVFEILFFVKYFGRLVKILFLTITAPLVAINDIRLKAKGATLINWVKQYLECLLMQPIHALLYLIFMFVANGIALSAPLIGVIFLWALLRGEKIVKIILNINYGKIFSIFKKA